MMRRSVSVIQCRCVDFVRAMNLIETTLAVFHFGRHAIIDKCAIAGCTTRSSVCDLRHKNERRGA